MIVSLDKLRAANITRVGGKGANLGELVAAGLPVPAGFCVTTDAYRAVIAPLADEVGALLRKRRHDELRALVVAAPLPDGLAERVAGAAERLGGPVAVRSSATAEDLPEASFAGQQETFLGVVGGEAVVEAMRRCWASLWSDRAIAYRAEQGYPDDAAAIAVVVQAMVAADAAGVAFTVDPVTGRRVVTIDSAWGLGESVVGGAVTPDSFVVDGGSIRRRIGDKAIRIDLAPGGGTRTSHVQPASRRRPSLTRRQVREVAALARQVQAHYGQPMDLEWALARGRAWLLQARPVTTVVAAPEAASDPGRHTRLSRFVRSDIIEHFPEPYPLDLVVVEAAYRALRSCAGFAGIGISPEQGLITLDDTGIARVGYPTVSLRRLPLGVARILRARASDPRMWEATHGAAARALVARMLALDLTSLTGPELRRTLTQLVDVTERHLEERFVHLGFHLMRGARIDALLWLARRGAASGPRTQFDLLGGLDYATAVIDRRLRGLARTAPAEVLALLGGERIDVAAVRAVDPAWWRDVEGFLTDFGARTPKMYLPFSTRGWREDLPAFLTMLGLVAHGTGDAPVGEHRALVAEAGSRLPAPLARRLERLVDDYRAGHVMREASVVELEELCAAARRVGLEAGRRLVADGLCERPGDVAFLSFAELGDWLDGREVDVAGIVTRRRAARPKAVAAWHETAEPACAAGAWVGVAASPGRATGRARVVSGPADFTRLERGDVLVCRATDPAWTPLFALAGGIVAETGGRLSHAAIVAREYAIPAVLGVAGATTRITDGARITVDGGTGRVTPAQ